MRFVWQRFIFEKMISMELRVKAGRSFFLLSPLHAESVSASR
jgi:hypothetical protein